MKTKQILLIGLLAFTLGASFSPVVFRNWVLQHDIDGDGHTISNAVFVGTDGATIGGDMVWTNDDGTIKPSGSPINASLSAQSFVQSNGPNTFLLSVGSTYDIANAVKAGVTFSGSSSNSVDGTTRALMNLYGFGFMENSSFGVTVVNGNGGTASNAVQMVLDTGQGESVTLRGGNADERITVASESGNVFTVLNTGQITLGGTTNHVTFGGTNTPPYQPSRPRNGFPYRSQALRTLTAFRFTNEL